MRGRGAQKSKGEENLFLAAVQARPCGTDDQHLLFGVQTTCTCMYVQYMLRTPGAYYLIVHPTYVHTHFSGVPVGSCRYEYALF